MTVACMNAVRPNGDWIRCGHEFDIPKDLDWSQVVCPSCLRIGTIAPVVSVPKPGEPVDTAKDTNVMAIEEMLAKYTRQRPSLEEMFRLAEETERNSVSEIGKRSSGDSHRRLAELVARQTEFLDKAMND